MLLLPLDAVRANAATSASHLKVACDVTSREFHQRCLAAEGMPGDGGPASPDSNAACCLDLALLSLA